MFYNIKFCPHCESVLSYNKNDLSELILICKRCNYIDNKDIKLRFTKFTNNSDTITEKSYAIPTIYTKYDQTLIRTTKINCHNIECKTNTEELSNNTIPNIILTNKSNKTRLMVMTCSICDCSWNVKNTEN